MQTIYLLARTRHDALDYLKSRLGLPLGITKDFRFIYLDSVRRSGAREGAFVEVPGAEHHPDFPLILESLTASGIKQIPLSKIPDLRQPQLWSNLKPEPVEEKPYRAPHGTCVLK